MRSDDILQTLIDSRHMAVHATAADTVEFVMGMRGERFLVPKFAVALQAFRVVTRRTCRPLWSDRTVWIVTINTLEFRITTPTRRVREFGLIPSGHSRRKLGTIASMTPATNPIEIVVSGPVDRKGVV